MPGGLSKYVDVSCDPVNEDSNCRKYGIGFRLAMVPEPSTGLLVIAGLLGLAGWRRGAPNTNAARVALNHFRSCTAVAISV